MSIGINGGFAGAPAQPAPPPSNKRKLDIPLPQFAKSKCKKFLVPLTKKQITHYESQAFKRQKIADFRIQEEMAYKIDRIALPKRKSIEEMTPVEVERQYAMILEQEKPEPPLDLDKWEKAKSVFSKLQKKALVIN
jgi:hypothetical protein